MRVRGTTTTLAAPLLLGGCGVISRGFLNAAGPVANGERTLFLIVIGVMLFVIAPVLLLTPLVAWHYRLSNTHTAYRPKWRFSWWIEGLIWIPPTLIVIGLAVVLWIDTQKLDPYRSLTRPGPPLNVQAVALDWKWLFIYPEQHLATINVLAVPAGRAVHVSLTSGTVMQSLLIPRLAGQIYAMAGMTTQLNFAANAPGTYFGENAQYNGEGFQEQKFTVAAMPASSFDEWVTQVRQSGQPFDDAAYQRLFKRSVPKNPILYANAPAGLYRKILDRDLPGIRSHDGSDTGKSR